MPHACAARVFVTLKPSVFDPQGRTIAEALHSLGYGASSDVRQGKYFELDLADRRSRRRREALAAEVADKLLANPVIESYRIEVVDRAGRRHEIRASIVFPGINCDQDAYHAATDVLGQQARVIWHKDTT